MTSPVATIAAPASTTTKLSNLLNPSPVKIAVSASTTTKSDNPHVKIVLRGNLTLEVLTLVKPAVQAGSATPVKLVNFVQQDSPAPLVYGCAAIALRERILVQERFVLTALMERRAPKVATTVIRAHVEDT